MCTNSCPFVFKQAKELDADWGDCEFELYCDPEDLIVMEFGLDSLDSPDGLGAYMNTMVRCNPIISEYGLSKVCVHVCLYVCMYVLIWLGKDRCPYMFLHSVTCISVVF